MGHATNKSHQITVRKDTSVTFNHDSDQSTESLTEHADKMPPIDNKWSPLPVQNPHAVATVAAVGTRYSHEALFRTAAQSTPPSAVIDLNAPEFAGRGEMVRKLADACAARGVDMPTTHGGIARLILESLAASHAAALDELEAVTATHVEDVHVVGGGARNVGAIMRRYGHLSAWWRVVRADGSSHDPAASVPRWDEDGLAHDGTRVALHVHRVHWQE